MMVQALQSDKVLRPPKSLAGGPGALKWGVEERDVTLSMN